MAASARGNIVLKCCGHRRVASRSLLVTAGTVRQLEEGLAVLLFQDRRHRDVEPTSCRGVSKKALCCQKCGDHLAAMSADSELAGAVNKLAISSGYCQAGTCHRHEIVYFYRYLTCRTLVFRKYQRCLGCASDGRVGTGDWRNTRVGVSAIAGMLSWKPVVASHHTRWR